MTFGFEERVLNNFKMIFSVIKNEYRSQGTVDLEMLVSSDKFSCDLSQLEILQTIFWLAEEMKIHFRVNKENRLPRAVKQILLENPGAPINIVTNKQVDTPIFQQVKKMGRTFLSDLPETFDQYVLSRCVVNELRKWHSRLISYEPRSKEKFFPGSKAIKNGLVLIERILEKQDSYSLLQSCFKYNIRIIQLSETMTLLTVFYTRQISFWEKLIDQMKSFEINLPEIKKNISVHSAFSRLLEIMESSHPYPLVTEAEELLPQVEKYHQELEQKKIKTFRKKSLEKIDRMINKLIGLFDTFECDPNYRNECLVAIRGLKMKIEAGSSIKLIQLRVNDAKDLFVDIIEEI